MFILVGIRSRVQEISGGQFYCARCDTIRPYTHKRLRNYLAVFFIPLVPLGTRGEYVECKVCLRTYTPEVLNPYTRGI